MQSPPQAPRAGRSERRACPSALRYGPAPPAHHGAVGQGLRHRPAFGHQRTGLPTARPCSVWTPTSPTGRPRGSCAPSAPTRPDPKRRDTPGPEAARHARIRMQACAIHSWPSMDVVRDRSFLRHPEPLANRDLRSRQCIEISDLLDNQPGIGVRLDRKSTRLNSSHEWTSYAVFCLKKKIEIYGLTSVVHTILFSAECR